MRQPGLRVGVLTTSYPRHPGDAAGHFVAAHAALVAARPGVASVDVVAAQPAHAFTGLPVQTIPGPAGLFHAGGAPDRLEATPIAGLGAAWFCARMAATTWQQRHQWDAVVAHWLAPSAWAAMSLRGPLLAIAHGGDIALLARLRLLGPTLALLRRRDARLVFVSRSLAAQAEAQASLATSRWLADAAMVQAMGVDDLALRMLPPPPSAGPLVVVVLARLVPIKGVDRVISAMAHVPPDVELHIAGDGPLRASLTAHAAASPAARRIVFHGALHAPARDALLARAHIVCIPSRQLPNRGEGMPLVAAEALLAGRRLIVTTSGGLADLPANAPDHPVTHVPTGPDAACALAIAAAITKLRPLPAAPASCRAIAATAAWPLIEPRLWHHWHRGQDPI